MVENKYIYKTPDVCKALGISRFTLIRWEKLGKFTAPRSVGNMRVFTEKQIEEIVEAFKPNSAGQWHFTS